MGIEDVVKTLRRERAKLAAQHKVRSLGVFGSVARADASAASDCDILVEFSDPPGLFGFVELEHELSALLGCKVDLVEKQSLKPGIAKRIAKDLVVV
jgi:predicted nucleotidyltransferase